MTKTLESGWEESRTEPEILSVRTAPDSVKLDLYLPPDLFQFKGHFPGQPILPGVAQLDWAARYSAEYFSLPGAFRRLGQLKFNKLIEAGAKVTLLLEFLPVKNRVQFSFSDEEGICSSGHLDLGEG